MGNVSMTIHAVGSHHNHDNPNDLNKMFARFVDEVKAAGHNVTHAHLHHGGAEDMLSANTATRAGLYGPLALAAAASLALFAVMLPFEPAYATDVNAPKPMLVRAAPVTVSPWSGFYVGGNFGTALTNQQYDFVSLPGVATGNLWPAGLLAGATVGYGGTVGSLYAGLETEFNYSFNRGQAACGVLGQCSIKDSLLMTQGIVIGAPMSTITGALPPLPQNTKLTPPSQWPIPITAPEGLSSANIMPLLKAGVAERNISACEAPVAGMPEVCGQTWLVGPYVGGELRFAVAQNWFAGIDYKYVIFNKSFTPANSVAVFGPFAQEFKNLNEQVVAFKVGYHL